MGEKPELEKANVTLGPPKRVETPKPEHPKRFARCFLCGAAVELRYSKRDKPYLVCDPCGLQAFVRKERGIAKLKAMAKAPKFDNARILELTECLDAVNSKLASIEFRKPLFGTDAELQLQENALLTTKNKILAEMREISRIPDKSGKGAELVHEAAN